jgi:hypothetical protein
VGEVLLVRGVHLHEVVHGGQEHVDLDDLADAGAGLLEHGREVVDAELGHLADRGLAEGQDLAFGGAGDLTAAVDGGGGDDGLRLCGLLV